MTASTTRVMDASNFLIVPMIIGGVFSITVTHRFTKRQWHREFAEEAQGQEVLEKLLADIEIDLTQPETKAAPCP